MDERRPAGARAVPPPARPRRATTGPLVFAPYLFWTTFACGQVAPERTILMPCLHDEPEAAPRAVPAAVRRRGRRLVPLRARARPGPRPCCLASRHHARGRAPASTCPAATTPTASAPHGIEGRFVLYAGRREGGKGWERLLDALRPRRDRHDLPFSPRHDRDGRGARRRPSVADRVVDLGFVSDDERNDAFAAADAYVQPSALRELLPHDHGGVAGRHAGDRQRRQRRRALALRAVRRRASPSTTTTSSSSACASWPSAPEAAAALAAPGPGLRARQLPLADGARPRSRTTSRRWTIAGARASAQPCAS